MFRKIIIFPILFVLYEIPGRLLDTSRRRYNYQRLYSFQISKRVSKAYFLPLTMRWIAKMLQKYLQSVSIYTANLMQVSILFGSFGLLKYNMLISSKTSTATINIYPNMLPFILCVRKIFKETSNFIKEIFLCKNFASGFNDTTICDILLTV